MSTLGLGKSNIYEGDVVDGKAHGKGKHIEYNQSGMVLICLRRTLWDFLDEQANEKTGSLSNEQ
jgi:hypothetical protein